MIQKINYFLTHVFDIILYPFSFIAEFWGIFFLSIIMAFVVLVIYKHVSSPTRIRKAKNQIKADILAIRLYKDLGSVIAASFFKSLWHTTKYFTLNFIPLLLIIPILFPAFVQMDIRYGLKPFPVGDDIMIKAKFNDDLRDLDIELLDNEYLSPKMKPVFVKALNEVNWKYTASKPGKTVIRIKAGNEIYEKSIIIGSSREAFSNRKMRQSQWSHFLYPVEDILTENGKIDYIKITYPGKSIHFAGFSGQWWVFNLILMLIIVLAFKNRFGIEF